MLSLEVATFGDVPLTRDGLREVILRLRFPGCQGTRRLAAVIAQGRQLPDGTVVFPDDPRYSDELPPTLELPEEVIDRVLKQRVLQPYSPDTPYCEQVVVAIQQLVRHPTPMVIRLVPETRRRLIDKADPFFGIPKDVYGPPEPTGRLIPRAVPAPPGVFLPLAGFPQSLLQRLVDRAPLNGLSFCVEEFAVLVLALESARQRQIIIPDRIYDGLHRIFREQDAHRRAAKAACAVPPEA